MQTWLNSTLLKCFVPKKPKPPLDIYAYVINREWGCYSLRENKELIDTAVFDGYNFTEDLSLEGDINPDKTWWQSIGKPAYVVFGNYGESGFDSGYSVTDFCESSG